MKITRCPRIVPAVATALLLAACGQSSSPDQTSPATPLTAGTPPSATTTLPSSGTSVPPLPRAGSVPTPATSAPVAASSSAASKPIAVDKVTLGSRIGADYKVTKADDTFAADDHSLYAAVDTSGQATGANLRATWTYEDGQTVNDITHSITADGPAVTTFKVHNAEDWPTGKYKVAISLDGKPVTTKKFEVASR